MARWRLAVVAGLALLGACGDDGGEQDAPTASTGMVGDTEADAPPQDGSFGFARVLGVAPAPCLDGATPDEAGERCYDLAAIEVGIDAIERATASALDASTWSVELVLTEEGLGTLNQLAASCAAGDIACPTQQLAIVLDGTVMSAPTVVEPSFERDQISITGSLTEAEATALADRLDPGTS